MSSLNSIDFVGDFFKKLEKDHVEYCILRNYENLGFEIGHDIDILLDDTIVKHGFNDYIERIVEDCGWSCAVKSNDDGFYTVICYKFDKEAEFIKLDIWTKFLWRGIPWIDERVVLGTARKYNEFYVPSLGAEAAISLLKEPIGGGCIPEKYYQSIIDGVTNDSKTFISATETTFGYYSHEMLEMCLNGNFIDLDQQRRRIQNLIKRNNSLKFWIESIKKVLKRAIKLLEPHGKVIVFVGPDGSGKSSVIEGISKKFSDLDYSIKKYHIRLKIFPELKTGLGISSMRGKITIASECPRERKPEKRSFLSKLASWLVVCYYALEFFVGKIVISGNKRKYDYIIFDRYFYDFYTQPTTRDLIWNVRKVLSFFITKPDIIIHLCADPQVVFNRKKELSVHEIEVQNKYMSAFLTNHRNAYKIINDRKSIDEIILEVFKIIVPDLL